MADQDDPDRSSSTDRIDEALYRSVLETAVDPIILIDGVGTMLEVNSATSTLFGYGLDEMIGQNVSMLMPEPYRSEHDSYLARYLRTGEARIIGIGREVVAMRVDETTFPIALAVSEVPGDHEPLFTGIIHDLTERTDAEQRLREANERLEERVAERTRELGESLEELSRSNRDLEQFAYIASHDLQAPLRNVRQGLELLDDHLLQRMGVAFDVEADELRSLILGAVGTMEDLIRGLLSYSRLQRSEDPATGRVDLATVAAAVVGRARMELDEIGGTIDIGPLPIVRGDSTQLTQLLQNLVHNAIKYRHDDRAPHIAITAEETDEGWVVSVADNGIGVDTAQHGRIFELFRRGHPGYSGVGLGLAICQRIVERHDGSIWVDSSPGEGATFSFSLPSREDRV